MADEDKREEGIEISSRLLGLLLLGIALIFTGVAVLVIASLVLGGASVGGVILIGPIPIVFGAGPEADWLIIASVILTIVSIVLFLIFYKRRQAR